MTLGYSNFVTTTGPVDIGTVGHGQSADPLLVNATPGPGADFHVAAAGSPVIGAGTADPNDGPTDRDGVTHPTAPAIGAYEFVPGTTTGGGDGGGTGATGGDGSVATIATISRLHQTHAVFAAGSSSTPVNAQAARRHHRGTVFSFRLDQPATVRIAIQRNVAGRRLGHRCRPDRPKLHLRPRCRRWVGVATLTRGGHAGRNIVAFSGRIRGKTLKPGRYRAGFTATDTAGRSRPQRLGFKIVKG